MTESHKDIASGLFFLALGIAAVCLSLGLPIGTLDAMGSGYLPLVIAILMTLIGLSIVLRGLRSRGTAAGRVVDDASGSPVPWRAIAFVALSTAIFAIVVTSFGLAPALFAGVLAASLATRLNAPRSAAAMALILSIICTVVFGYALGVPIPILRFGG